LGVELITEQDHLVHVSGHPAQDELISMYQMVRPKIAVPVHGETRHLMAQARLAEQCQVPQSIVTRNGEVVKLAPGPASVIGEVPTGRLVVDGTRLLPSGAEALRSRQRMTFNGAALATIVVDSEGRLRSPPQVTVQGMGAAEEDASLTEELRQRVEQALEELGPRERRDDAALREAARLAVRRSLRAWHGKKPVTEIHLVRI
jgi:ribonuclease J